MEDAKHDSILLEYLRVRDVERVLHDLQGDRRRCARLRDQSLSDPLTWARWTSTQNYLIRLPSIELMMPTAHHYALHMNGQLFLASTASRFESRLVVKDSFTQAASLREEVMLMFTAGLKVYGKFGLGQDGQFNVTGRPTPVDAIDPYFDSPAGLATPPKL